MNKIETFNINCWIKTSITQHTQIVNKFIKQSKTKNEVFNY